jgi:hypothetical protein
MFKGGEMQYTVRILLVLVAICVGSSRAAETPAVQQDAAAKATEYRQAFAAQSQGKPPSYRLVLTPSKTIEAVLTYRVEAPNLVAKEWIFFAPGAVELVRQTGVAAELTPGGQAADDLGPLKHPLLWARVPAVTEELKKRAEVIVRYRARLMAQRLERVKPGERVDPVPPPGEAESAAALAPTLWLDWESPVFQDWLVKSELHPLKDESDLAFGRRVFLFIRKQCSYEYRADMDRRASHVCQALRSDCGGLAALFSAVMRARGIPARVLCGRWAQSAKPGDRAGEMPYQQQHVKAEFFCIGIGWVPADLSSAILHDRSPDGLQYFGRDPGDFLVMHVDSGFEFDTIQFGRKRVEVMQNPVFWVTGAGTVDDHRILQDWQVREVKAPDK